MPAATNRADSFQTSVVMTEKLTSVRTSPFFLDHHSKILYMFSYVFILLSLNGKAFKAYYSNFFDCFYER